MSGKKRCGLGWAFSPAWVWVAAVLLTPVLQAQVRFNGVPASVTSSGFGGNFGPQGVPASVTSFGFGQTNSRFFAGPTCCFFGENPNFRLSHHRQNAFSFGGYPLYWAPYYYPPMIVEPVDDTMEGNYGPGPTIFDRRGPGRRSLAYEQQYDERLRRLERQINDATTQPRTAEKPQGNAADQSATILVYRDGHTTEIKNYAIVGETLYDFSTDRQRKIALADLDLTATQRQNEDRGVDFRLPARPSGN